MVGGATVGQLPHVQDNGDHRELQESQSGD